MQIKIHGRFHDLLLALINTGFLSGVRFRSLIIKSERINRHEKWRGKTGAVSPLDSTFSVTVCSRAFNEGSTPTELITSGFTYSTKAVVTFKHAQA